MADTTGSASAARGAVGTRIQFDGVEKAYGDQTVLHGIDLNIEPGEFVALLGPSGCGKTTMLRCLAGLEAISDGRILLDGQDISPVPVNRRDMSVVFQAYSLFPHMTVAQNIAFGLKMRRVSAPERHRRVAEALELVGLGDLSTRYAHQLSGGQQQRVALARALVTRPRALLLDEPLSALDAKVRVRLRDEIKAIQAELGITTIFVTHDQEEALAVADRVAVMRDGVIEQLGTPEELYRRPATPFVASFVGESNRLEGVLGNGTVRVCGVDLPVLERVDPGGVSRSETAPAAGSTVRAFVRPEQLVIEGGAAGIAGGVPAVVVSSGFLGAYRRTRLRLPGGEVVTAQHGAGAGDGQVFAPDQAVTVRFLGDPVAVEPAGGE